MPQTARQRNTHRTKRTDNDKHPTNRWHKNVRRADTFPPPTPISAHQVEFPRQAGWEELAQQNICWTDTKHATKIIPLQARCRCGTTVDCRGEESTCASHESKNRSVNQLQNVCQHTAFCPTGSCTFDSQLAEEKNSKQQKIHSINI